jgi:hypothetical protein
MRSKKLLVAILAASALLMGAKSGDLKEYAGEVVSSEEGIVVLRVIRRQSEGGAAGVLKKDYKTLVGVLKSVDGKRRLTIEDIDKIRAVVLPAGRWYVAELRTQAERDLPPIAKSHQSFEVVGGSINYAGQYTVTFETGSDGKPQSNVDVSYDQDLITEAATAFPDPFAAMALLYCPIGRKCKPAAEFNR